MGTWTQEAIAINSNEASLQSIEQYARKAAKGNRKYVSLVSWWNRKSNMGGPAAAVFKSRPKSIRKYAEARGADVRVSVNQDEFVFYYLLPEALAESERNRPAQ